MKFIKVLGILSCHSVAYSFRVSTFVTKINKLPYRRLCCLPNIRCSDGNTIDESKPFVMLGIETSCDDTGVAVVRSDGVMMSNVVFSQVSIEDRSENIFRISPFNTNVNNI
jgi:hypothetical protein